MSIEILNWSAFLSLFIAYVLLLKGVFNSKNKLYLILQIIGGSSFIVLGIYSKIWSLWLFNSVWVVVSMLALLSVITKKKLF